MLDMFSIQIVQARKYRLGKSQPYLFIKLNRKARNVLSIDLAFTLSRGVTVEPMTLKGLKFKMTLRIRCEMEGLVRTSKAMLFMVAVTIRASLTGRLSVVGRAFFFNSVHTSWPPETHSTADRASPVFQLREWR